MCGPSVGSPEGPGLFRVLLAKPKKAKPLSQHLENWLKGFLGFCLQNPKKKSQTLKPILVSPLKNREGKKLEQGF